MSLVTIETNDTEVDVACIVRKKVDLLEGSPYDNDGLLCPSFLHNPNTLFGTEQGSVGSDPLQGFRGCVGWGDICIGICYSSASEVNRIFMSGVAETMENKVLIIEEGF